MVVCMSGEGIRSVFSAVLTNMATLSFLSKTLRVKGGDIVWCLLLLWQSTPSWIVYKE